MAMYNIHFSLSDVESRLQKKDSYFKGKGAPGYAGVCF